MKKNLPIGVSDFKILIEEDFAYVDKSLLIQEVVDKGVGRVLLFPRMRRFGKTLNLSMLRYFFEKSEENTSHLFTSLQIWNNEKCRALQGQFPVIFLSLKDIKSNSWEETLAALRRVIAEEFARHRYLLDGKSLTAEEKDDYLLILRKEGHRDLYERSLFLLTQWLHRHHKKRVILLIDEYDTPAHEAYVGGFYNEFITFLRNWFSGGLKDNRSLEKGVLTGILRIAKESVFSGLNNISTFTILNEEFQDKFGLLESEVKKLLADYDLIDKLPELRKWYNGYRIGSCGGIYNPWSILNCIEKKGFLTSYWVNTSDNALVKQLIAQSSYDLKADLEELLKGGVIEKPIEEGIIFTNLPQNTDSIWSLLLFSGYLTIASTPKGTDCYLRIPNMEVGELYKSMIIDWFKQTIHANEYQLLLNTLISGVSSDI